MNDDQGTPKLLDDKCMIFNLSKNLLKSNKRKKSNSLLEKNRYMLDQLQTQSSEINITRKTEFVNKLSKKIEVKKCLTDSPVEGIVTPMFNKTSSRTKKEEDLKKSLNAMLANDETYSISSDS